MLNTNMCRFLLLFYASIHNRDDLTIYLSSVENKVKRHTTRTYDMHDALKYMYI